MTKHLGRDEIWSNAIDRAMKKECFSTDQMQSMISESVTIRTIRDTLNTMVDKEWLSNKESQTQNWCPGPRILRQGDRDEEFEMEGSATKVTNASTLRKGEIYIGVVDRFSNSGNANLKLPKHMDREFVNLGPIGKGSKGEKVKFEFLETGWGRCLTERYTYSGYNPRDRNNRSLSSSGETADTQTSDGSEEESAHSSATKLSEASALQKGEVYVGVVERFSNNDNALVTPPSHIDSDIINLGKINKQSKDETVKFKLLNGTWGRCLSEEYTHEDYHPRGGNSSYSFSKVSSRRSSSSSKSHDFSKEGGRNLNRLLTGPQ
ncbi:hypothetical protein [Halorubrum halophilum]|uniref:hypothetical protein n=1 Tax=Halorubrum halophilum TaxID=413816 RepID=UPI0012AB8C3D|nr:hypothetical protein [Halorubrum halophilum]